MKAAWYARQGAARDVLEVGERPDPTPGPGEVRVRLAFSGINPVDVKRRAGGRGGMDDEYVVPHFDGAGVIDAIGPDVDGSRLGQRVWVYEAQWRRAGGTAAEYVTLPEQLAVTLPTTVSGGEVPLQAAACLGIPALTAYQCVLGDGPVTGQLVLVTGAAGGVGNYAVQFAALGGATVIATVSSEAKGDWAREAGADHVIDYTQADVAREVERIAGGAGVDRIVDVAFAANMETSLAVLKPGGTLSTYACDVDQEPRLPFYRFMYLAARLHFELVFLMRDDVQQRALADITRWLADDRLVHRPGQTFPLERIAEAHEAVEGGAQGRVLLAL